MLRFVNSDSMYSTVGALLFGISIISDTTCIKFTYILFCWADMPNLQAAPKDWQYSSFNKFVKDGYYENDWCNFEDKYDINKLDYE